MATALVTIAQSLRRFAYVYANGCGTVDEALLYPANFGARELMVIWPNFTCNGQVKPALISTPVQLKWAPNPGQGVK